MSLFSVIFAATPLLNRGGVLSGALPQMLTKPAAIADDALPSFDEITHWSGRLTHAAIALGIALGFTLTLHYLTFMLLRRISKASSQESVLIRRFNHSSRWAMIAIGLALASQTSLFLSRIWAAVGGFVVSVLIGWVVLSGVRALADTLQRHAEAGEDWIAARSRRTRITLLARTADALIIVATVAMIMLGIPAVRQIGATLIASAGLIGLAVGAAAQPALKALIAGLQIAFTQPLRIGDYVVLDGESGRVEDIRFSYVVICTSDERRLIVPTTKFLDGTFQNWTRANGLTGSVTLPIRPGTEIAPIRAAFNRLLAEQPAWDKRSSALSVSATSVGAIELTLSMSADGPAAIVTLKSTMREAMLEWLRTDIPDALCIQPS